MDLLYCYAARARSAHLLQPIGHPGRRLRLPSSRHGPHGADPVPHPRVRLRVDQSGRRGKKSRCLTRRFRSIINYPPLGHRVPDDGGIGRWRERERGRGGERGHELLIDARPSRQASRLRLTRWIDNDGWTVPPRHAYAITHLDPGTSTPSNSLSLTLQGCAKKFLLSSV